MNPTRHAALVRLPALAVRPKLRRLTHLYEADPARAARISATLDDLTPDHAKSAIDGAARDALIARFRALRGEA